MDTTYETFPSLCRHTSRFLICFITFLPFGLWGYTSWLTIPVMAVITFLLVGTENIGIQIEQPMLVLPLEILSAGTKAAVEAMSMAQGQADRWAQLPEDLRAISGVDGQAQGTPNGK